MFSPRREVNTAATLRARWILPISSPPIENGFVEIAGGQIVRTGKLTPDISISHDLGDVAILPGLVNAHTHLEFSDLECPIGHAGMELADWIIEVIRSRASRQNDKADSAGNAIEHGAAEALRSGTVLVGEISTTPWHLPTLPLEIVSYAEVLGLSPVRAAERFEAAAEHIRCRPGFSGISPHAPYSAPPELITRCVHHAVQIGCPLAMHAAESPAERELLQHGSGPFSQSLKSIGLDIASHFPWPSSSSSSFTWLIEQLSRAPAASIIHGNDFRPDEIAKIASYPSLSVVYCPRTHAYFGHALHPVAEMLAAGVNVALGTDSRASNPDLQLWREVRHLLHHRQDLPPATVLRFATLGGAIAMQREHRYGTVQPGRMATFALVPTTAAQTSSLYSDLATADATTYRIV